MDDYLPAAFNSSIFFCAFVKASTSVSLLFIITIINYFFKILNNKKLSKIWSYQKFHLL